MQQFLRCREWKMSFQVLGQRWYSRGGEWYLENSGSRKILFQSQNLRGVFNESQNLVFLCFFASWILEFLAARSWSLGSCLLPNCFDQNHEKLVYLIKNVRQQYFEYVGATSRVFKSSWRNILELLTYRCYTQKIMQLMSRCDQFFETGLDVLGSDFVKTSLGLGFSNKGLGISASLRFYCSPPLTVQLA